MKIRWLVSSELAALPDVCVYNASAGECSSFIVVQGEEDDVDWVSLGLNTCDISFVNGSLVLDCPNSAWEFVDTRLIEYAWNRDTERIEIGQKPTASNSVGENST